MTSEDIQRIAHLNEIVVSDWPAEEDYTYKLRLEVSSLFSPDVFVKELGARKVPAWMINVQQDPQSRVELILSYRQSGSQGPWTEVGRANLSLTEALTANPSAANVTLPVTTWAEAPKLKLRVRLLSSLYLERTRGLRQVPHIHSTRPEHFVKDQEEVAALQGEPFAMPEMLALTEPEEVIIKDTWNKLLAWKELAVPMFYRRLTHKAPALGEKLEPVAEGMAEQFFGLLDLCVRSLQPHTEQVQREAYRGVHPSPDFPCDTVEKYGRLFADMGMRPEDWRVFRDSLLWVLPSVPYIEDYELKNLELGKDSAWHRFLNGYVRRPMLEAIHLHDAQIDSARLQDLKQAWSGDEGESRRIALESFRQLFQSAPQTLKNFSRVDIDQVSQTCFSSLEAATAALHDWRRLAPTAEGSPGTFFDLPSRIIQPAVGKALKSEASWLSLQMEEAWNSVASRSGTVWEQASRRDHRLLRKATEYVEKVGKEFGWDQRDLEGRLYEIGEEIAATGSYTHTYEEMGYGSQMAWRNASKCVGRLAWKQLMVRDLRHVNHPDDMFEELKEHLRAANNGGKVNPTLSMFRPMRPGEAWGPRIWNPQLIRYAAYRLSDGKIMGDPANLGLTDAIMKLGWMPPNPRSPWDILPLVIEVPGMQPSLYEVPEDLVLEVHVKHPKYEQMAHLGLRWYVIPAISNFRLEIGGISYACCPFNGWYLVTEVARDFTDDYRYDKLEEIAEALGLDTSSLQTMWRDEAFLEVNKAILYSFQKSKMTIVDHHSASRQFLTHDLREKKAGRECPGQWSWVVPPLGGTTCPVYHHEMRDFFLEPQYYYHADKWAVETESGFAESSWLAAEMTDDGAKVRVLHASEDGDAEHVARMAARRLKTLKPVISAMADLEAHELNEEATALLLVVSSFQDGRLPAGAEAFLETLKQKTDGAVDRMSFAILVLGDATYDRCGAVADPLVEALTRIGGRLMLPVAEADALAGRGARTAQWLSLVGRIMGLDATAAVTEVEAPERRLALKELSGSADIRPQPLRGAWAKVAGCGSEDNGHGAKSYHLVIDTAGTNLSYEIGDQLAIFPDQGTELAERLSRRLGLASSTMVSGRYVGVFGEELEDAPPFPSPISLSRLFSHELELCWSEPFPELFQTLWDLTSDSAEKARLQDLMAALDRGDAESKRTSRRQLASLYPTVVDLLEAFPSAQLKVKTLVEVLPKASPLYFTVISSSEAGGQLRVVFDLPASPESAPERFLAGLSAGDEIHIDIRATAFRLPEDAKAPLLFVGTGAGVAAAAELAGVAAASRPGTAMVLTSGGSDAFKTKLSELSSQGALVGHHDGASLDAALRADSAELCKLLRHPDSHVFFSGETLEADEMYDTMVLLLQDGGELSYTQAIDTLEMLRSSGRWHRNVFTATPGKTSVDAVRQAKYAQGERWLRRYSVSHPDTSTGQAVAAGG